MEIVVGHGIVLQQNLHIAHIGFELGIYVDAVEIFVIDIVGIAGLTGLGCGAVYLSDVIVNRSGIEVEILLHRELGHKVVADVQFKIVRNERIGKVHTYTHGADFYTIAEVLERLVIVLHVLG